DPDPHVSRIGHAYVCVNGRWKKATGDRLRSRDYTGRPDEGDDPGVILAAGGGFDATGDIDHPGSDTSDVAGDVGGSQAASEDEGRENMVERWQGVEKALRDRPARPTELPFDAGVYQDGAQGIAKVTGLLHNRKHSRDVAVRPDPAGADDLQIPQRG